MVGLLGPNGAGKTTLIRMLLGFIRPTAGTGKVCGLDIVQQSLQVRREIAYLPAEARLYRAMRGRDILELFAGLHAYGDLKNSRLVAQRLDLDTSQRAMFMSTGNRQKLAIAVVLGCPAPLIVLDEPTANLDPDVRGEVLQLIAEVRSSGRSVLLSSHIFSDIDETCDHLAILKHGRLVHEQSLRGVEQLHVVILNPKHHAPQLPQVGSPPFVEFIDTNADGLRLHLSGSPDCWLPWLANQGFDVQRITHAGVQSIYDRQLDASAT